MQENSITKILMNPWTVTVIGGLIISSISYMFSVRNEKKIKLNNGGHGGNAEVTGSNSVAIGGKGGGGGPGGRGGDGGSGKATGDNIFVIGGEGGEAGQLDRGGKGGRGPLHVLMEEYPDEFKEITKTFGITEKMAKTIGKGGDGGDPSIVELQK